jgi:hypothetical protein
MTIRLKEVKNWPSRTANYVICTTPCALSYATAMKAKHPTPAQLARAEDRLLAREKLARWLAQQPSRTRALVAVLARGPRGWRAPQGRR